MKRRVKLPPLFVDRFQLSRHTSSECAPPPQPARGCARTGDQLSRGHIWSSGVSTLDASGRSHELRHPSIRARPGRCTDRRRKRRYDVGGGTICLTASRATKHLHVLTHQPTTRPGLDPPRASPDGLPCPRRPRGPEMRTIKSRLVAPHREQDARQPARERHGADPRATPFGELVRPGP